MKVLFFAFYLCWTLLTFIFISVPASSDLSPILHASLGSIVLGVYLLILSSLAHGIIKKTVFLSRREIAGYGVVVAVLLSVFFFGRQTLIHSSVLGGAMSTANLLFGATVLGSLLATAINRVGELVPVCITAAVADAISVSKGPTKAMIGDITQYYTGGREGAVPLVDFILVKIGIPGFDNLVPVFGITDWIFVVLLSAALHRLNLSDNAFPARLRAGRLLAVPVAALALYITIIIAQITGLFIPAMVGIALLFLAFLMIKHDLHRNVKRTDVYYSVFFSSAVAVSLIVYARNFA